MSAGAGRRELSSVVLGVVLSLPASPHWHHESGTGLCLYRRHRLGAGTTNVSGPAEYKRLDPARDRKA